MRTNIPAVSWFSMALADMDLDGDLDAVVPSVSTDAVVWYEFDGVATFPVEHPVGALGYRASGVVAGDFDRDGDVDVASGGIDPVAGVRWFEADGAGGFAPAAPLLDGYITTDQELGLSDVSGDGIPDIWRSRGSVAWIDTSVPSAQWSPATVGPWLAFAAGACVADVDDDGDVDVVATDSTGLQAFLNAGDATFSESRYIAPGFDSDSPPLAVDADADGDLDLVFGQGQYQSPPTVFWCENLGGGQYGPKRIVSVHPPGSSDPVVRAGDIDGDGDQDLFVDFVFFLTARWVRNDGGGNFTDLVALSSMPPPAAVADLDGDGTVEILDIRSTGGTFQDPLACSLILHDVFPDGSHGAPVRITSFVDGCPYDQRVCVVDATGDGVLDVVLHDPDLGALVTLPGLGNLSFGPAQLLAPSSIVPLRIEAVDVDLDGALDLVAFSYDEGLWFRSLSPGTFAPGQPFPHGGLSVIQTTPYFADFDGDGDPDLLHGSRNPVIQLNGTRLGARVCGADTPNSTGAPGTIWAEGADFAAAGDLTLRAAHLPPQQFGIFIVSPEAGTVVHPGGSLGTLCLGGAIGRFSRPGEILGTGSTGTVSLAVDLTNVPTPTGPESIEPGDTRLFQFWHRDGGAGAPANLTGAIRIHFR